MVYFSDMIVVTDWCIHDVITIMHDPITIITIAFLLAPLRPVFNQFNEKHGRYKAGYVNVSVLPRNISLLTSPTDCSPGDCFR